MCLGADSHLKADRGYYLCYNDDIECLQSYGCRQGHSLSVEEGVPGVTVVK